MANLENFSRENFSRENSSRENYSRADCNREISELMSILKKEIKSLRAGDFQNIEHTSKIKAEKTKSLAMVMASLDARIKTDIDLYRQHLAPRLAQLKNLSKENGLLLRGVLRGVKSAGERLHALKSLETRVGVYGRQGKSLSFEEQAVAHEKTF